MALNRLIFPLTVFIFLAASCGQKTDKAFQIDNKSGMWRIDSVAGLKNYYKTDYIYIVDSKWWRICRDTCPMIIDSCLTIKNDSVFKQGKLKYFLTAKDSSTLFIKNLSDKDFIVHSITQISDDYKQYLSEDLKGDSLIRHLPGWWQLTSPTEMAIHLPNNPEHRKILKLHLDKNGEAHFYFYPHKDSSEYYCWTAKPNMIDFARDCIPESNTEVTYLSENELKLFMRLNLDTLVFKRCDPIK
jgi:hypothetical protein